MNKRLWLVAAFALSIVAGCASSGPEATSNPTTSPPPTPTVIPTPVPSPAPTLSAAPAIQNIMALPGLRPIEPGTYFMDPDFDPSTPLRVVYEVPFEGWSQWAGTVKFNDDDGHVAVSITTVVNLVSDGCSDHSWADPPVGPSVDDLATALATLAPFQVTSPPKDVTMFGYSGKHLELTVPDLPVEGVGDRVFTGCVGRQLKSWVAPFDTDEPGDAFYGYTGPGYSEEFWILDVEGTRLMIAAEQSAGSPSEDIAEMRAILDSIRIEP
jgi:hypothetical protein